MLPKSLLLSAMPLLLASSTSAEPYKFTTLNPLVPNYTLMYPVAINDRGHVLFNAVNNTTGTSDAIFVLSKHGITRIHFPGAQPDEVHGTAISADDMVGGSLVARGRSGASFFELTDEGQLNIMPPPPPANADNSLYAMNARGDFTTNGINGTANGHPYYFVNGSYYPIQYPGVSVYTASGISNNDTVVGTFIDLQAGYILRKGAFTLFTVPGADWTHANGISDNGRYICGDYSVAHDVHCFVRNRRGEFTRVDYPAPKTINSVHGVETLQHFSSALLGVNDKGQICGLCVARYGNSTATDVVQFGFTASRTGDTEDQDSQRGDE